MMMVAQLWNCFIYT